MVTPLQRLVANSDGSNLKEMKKLVPLRKLKEVNAGPYAVAPLLNHHQQLDQQQQQANALAFSESTTDVPTLSTTLFLNSTTTASGGSSNDRVAIGIGIGVGVFILLAITLLIAVICRSPRQPSLSHSAKKPRRDSNNHTYSIANHYNAITPISHSKEQQQQSMKRRDTARSHKQEMEHSAEIWQGAEQPEGQVSGGGTTGEQKQHKVILDYDPLLNDEIELEIGDYVVIEKEFEDGWAHGKNLRTGKSGAFPNACITTNT